jgi:hypothetical protein
MDFYEKKADMKRWEETFNHMDSNKDASVDMAEYIHYKIE